jgi:hypothetical protein
MQHVDDWIYDSIARNKEEGYAKWFFHLRRLPAALQKEWHDHIKEYKLFCTFESKRYRVTGASRFGDIWLTPDFEQETGYEKRVNLAECSNWSPSP